MAFATNTSPNIHIAKGWTEDYTACNSPKNGFSQDLKIHRPKEIHKLNGLSRFLSHSVHSGCNDAIHDWLIRGESLAGEKWLR